MNIVIRKLTCRRCAHKWVPRQTDVLICPKCKSPRWYQRKPLKAPVNG